MRFVVLLRGVNVGRANRVPMAALRTMHEWDAIVAGNPLADAAVDASRLLVVVAPHESVLEALAPAGKLVTKGEGWHLGHDAAYLHCPEGLLGSKAGAALLGRPGRVATTRNWSTVQKVAALLREAGWARI